MEDLPLDKGHFITGFERFMWKELNDSHPAVLVVLREAQSVREASDAVLLWYEKPADTSAQVQAKRAGYGQGHYDKYAGKPEVKPEKPASKGMSNVQIARFL